MRIRWWGFVFLLLVVGVVAIAGEESDGSASVTSVGATNNPNFGNYQLQIDPIFDPGFNPSVVSSDFPPLFSDGTAISGGSGISCSTLSCRAIDEVWLRIRGLLSYAEKVWDKNLDWTTMDKVYPVVEAKGVPAVAVSGAKLKMKQIAEREWELWGEGNKKETDSEMIPVVNKYYSAGQCYYPGISTSNTPWSAAFISYVAREVRVSFPFSCAHINYFNTLKDVPGYACITYPISQKDKVEVGDIVCRCRTEPDDTAACTLNYNDLPVNADTHCDIVVSKSGTTIEGIGGNLDNSVMKRSLNINDPKYFGFISCGS